MEGGGRSGDTKLPRSINSQILLFAAAAGRTFERIVDSVYSWCSAFSNRAPPPPFFSSILSGFPLLSSQQSVSQSAGRLDANENNTFPDGGRKSNINRGMNDRHHRHHNRANYSAATVACCCMLHRNRDICHWARTF